MGAKSLAVMVMDPRAKPFPDGTTERMLELERGEMSRAMRERILTIRLLSQGHRVPDVARIVGRSEGGIRTHKRRFLTDGESYVTSRVSPQGGRRNQVMSLAEEAALMAGLIDAAEEGQVVTAHQVKAAIEQHAGRPVGTKTVYRLMHRQGWRKVVPRPTHPDGDPAARRAFEETSPSA